MTNGINNKEELIFNNAPLVLAVAQIRFSLPEDFRITDFLKKDHIIKHDFPQSRTNFTGQIKIQDIIEGSSTASLRDKKENGYQYISKNKKRFLSIERNKFTYDHRNDYDSWPIFKSNLLKAWEYFDNIHNEIAIKGISIRFINEFTINEQLDNPLDFFNYIIYVNEDARADDINKYFLNFSYFWGHNRFSHLSHNITQINDQEFKAILDIDVHNQDIASLSNPVEDIFEELHDELKSRFFKSITDKLKSYLL